MPSMKKLSQIMRMGAREKSQEADLLRSKLQEMALIEENLQVGELERAQPAAASESVKSNDCLVKNNGEDQEDEELANSALLGKLEEKKKELTSMEEAVHDLRKWAEVQDMHSSNLPSSARENIG
ncbi:hypothetical protein HAX54_030589 [Datura stramonium]|uniref:Uncharacterized protein n=1 Tax=Datura stramonium TaxID=4076 RepID=A0ABS8VAZ2_DATST|nr:hypothetical protein [Datura stramonium]